MSQKQHGYCTCDILFLENVFPSLIFVYVNGFKVFGVNAVQQRIPVFHSMDSKPSQRSSYTALVSQGYVNKPHTLH